MWQEISYNKQLLDSSNNYHFLLKGDKKQSFSILTDSSYYDIIRFQDWFKYEGKVYKILIGQPEHTSHSHKENLNSLNFHPFDKYYYARVHVKFCETNTTIDTIICSNSRTTFLSISIANHNIKLDFSTNFKVYVHFRFQITSLQIQCMNKIARNNLNAKCLSKCLQKNVESLIEFYK